MLLLQATKKGNTKMKQQTDGLCIKIIKSTLLIIIPILVGLLTFFGFMALAKYAIPDVSPELDSLGASVISIMFLICTFKGLNYETKNG